MSRPLRIEYDGAVYHITSRGNARSHIFKDSEDRKYFLDTIHKVNSRYNWICHAYCLMNNHYHLIIETPDGNLSKGMRQLNGVYTQLFNRKHKRVGHIFQGRYKAILIQKESHLLEVCRYVVLNPVNAKIVGTPKEWKWSSYRATLGIEKQHPCLTVDWILSQFSLRGRRDGGKYGEFVRAGIREVNIWKEVKGQCILGRDNFIERLIKYVKGHEEIKEIPKNQRYVSRPGLNDIFHDKVLCDKERRNKKIVESVDEHGYSQRELADYLEMHYSTISKLIKKDKQ